MLRFLPRLSVKSLAIRIVALWCLIFFQPAALAKAANNLPVRDWNLENLEKIKTMGPKALTFAVVGDNREDLTVFSSLLKQIDTDPEVSFVIHVGDVVRDGQLEEYQKFFQVVKDNLRKPLLVAPGNHDLKEGRDRRLLRELFGPSFLSFHIDRHYFILLDNAERYLDRGQWQWLTKELEQTKPFQSRLVFLHYPIIHPSRKDSRHSLEEREGRQLTGLLRLQGVTHIFAGHIHGYLTGQWDGIPYTITGGGGAPLSGRDPNHYFFHYLKVSVQGKEPIIQVQRLK